jgi:hypothetical protein
MPVTRHPPCSPGRTVFPYPVPRLYAPPRGKALSSREHPPLCDLRDARPGYPSPVPGLGELLPGKTLPLPPAPIAPVKHPAHSALDKAIQGAGVALPTVVGVVASQPAVPLPGERASRQVPVLCAPCRDPPARRLELLARGTPLATWHALAIWPPVPLASPKRDASPHARMQATEAQEGGLVGGALEVALRSPLGEHPRDPFCVVVVAKGADPVGGGAAQQGFTPTVGLDDFITPQGQGIVHIPIGPDG